MLETRIVQLNDNNYYYVVKQQKIDSKDFVLLSKCDIKEETIDEDNFVLAEVIIDKDNNLMLKSIEDQNYAIEISKKILNPIE